MSVQFVYPSINRHLDCFHLLAIVPGVSMNIHIQVFVWPLLSIISNVNLEVELLCHGVIIDLSL
jgi:hypothetical protein